MKHILTSFFLATIAIAACASQDPVPQGHGGGGASTTSGSGGAGTSPGTQGGSVGDGGSTTASGGSGGSGTSAGSGGTAGASGSTGGGGNAGSSGAAGSSGSTATDGGARTCAGGYTGMCPAPYSVGGTIDDLCKAYCDCMMGPCSSYMPSDCVNTCKSKANSWDLCCRIKMCKTRPCDYMDQFIGDCKAAVGIQACLDKT